MNAAERADAMAMPRRAENALTTLLENSLRDDAAGPGQRDMFSRDRGANDTEASNAQKSRRGLR